jgi:hypothetical protein
MLKITTTKKNKNKYNAQPTTLDDITFASKHEAKVYFDLKMLEKSGNIKNLALQVPYTHTVNGKKCFKYIADFVFFDIEKNTLRIVDAKGCKQGSAWNIFRLKQKCIEAEHNIEIELW